MYLFQNIIYKHSFPGRTYIYVPAEILVSISIINHINCKTLRDILKNFTIFPFFDFNCYAREFMDFFFVIFTCGKYSAVVIFSSLSRATTTAEWSTTILKEKLRVHFLTNFEYWEIVFCNI